MGKKAGLGWFTILSFVAAYDYWACKSDNETLTAAIHRSIEHKVMRWPVILFSGLLAKHLFTPKVAPKIDPFSYIAVRWRIEQNSLHYNLEVE